MCLNGAGVLFAGLVRIDAKVGVGFGATVVVVTVSPVKQSPAKVLECVVVIG